MIETFVFIYYVYMSVTKMFRDNINLLKYSFAILFIPAIKYAKKDIFCSEKSQSFYKVQLILSL